MNRTRARRAFYRRRYTGRMRILAIDMGTGTQDILLFDSDKPVENNVKMVLPSARAGRP